MRTDFLHFSKGGIKNKNKNKLKDQTNQREHKGQKRKVHTNRYEEFSHLNWSKRIYDPRNKRLRQLPIEGKAGEVIKAGFSAIFHGRLYRLLRDITIPETGIIFGNFRLVRWID